MQDKARRNHLLGSEKVFVNSASGERLPPLSTTLHRASRGIQSLLNSAGEAGTTNDRDLGVSGGKIIEDYDGQRNIFSISTGAGELPELSSERQARGDGLLQGCVRMMFNEFCETTGLHGWKYLTRVSQITHLVTVSHALISPQGPCTQIRKVIWGDGGGGGGQ